MAAGLYLDAFGGRYPCQSIDGVDDWRSPSAKPNWARSLETYVRNAHIPVCPCYTKRSACRTNCPHVLEELSYPISYFGNGRIFRGGLSESRLRHPSSMVLFQCCGQAWNKCWLAPTWNEEYGAWESYVSPSWCAHKGGTNLAFADGHIHWMLYRDLASRTQLFWPADY